MNSDGGGTMNSDHRRQVRPGRVVLYGVITCGAAIMLIPLSWMVLTSLKTFVEVLQEPTRWIPALAQWSNYRVVFQEFDFGLYLWNSVFVTAMSITGSLISCCLAAYAFVFIDVRFKGPIFAALLSTMLLPAQVTIIPLFKFFATIGWVNTYLPLILPHWLGLNVFAIFLMRQFFLTIPKAYVEAARMDGASELSILWNVVVPLSTPVLLAATVFTFLASWNDLFGPLIYLHDERLFTMPIGLFSFIAKAGVLEGGGGTAVTPWNLVMSLTTVMIVPVIVVFFLAQKRFIEGVAASGLKG